MKTYYCHGRHKGKILKMKRVLNSVRDFKMANRVKIEKYTLCLPIQKALVLLFRTPHAY